MVLVGSLAAAVLGPLEAIGPLALWSLFGAGWANASSAAGVSSSEVAIGSKPFTEQYVLTELLGDFELFERPEWQALASRYALAFGRERAMDSSLLYEALCAARGTFRPCAGESMSSHGL